MFVVDSFSSDFSSLILHVGTEQFDFSFHFACMFVLHISFVSGFDCFPCLSVVYLVVARFHIFTYVPITYPSSRRLVSLRSLEHL